MKPTGEVKSDKLNLKERVRANYPTLPENQRIVADFLLQNQRDIPFLSIEEIKKKTGVSKATIVRLAQSLGLSGFQELRSRLLERVQNAMKLTDKFQLLSKADNKEVLTLVAHQDVKNINQTINHLDRKTFREVGDLILKSSHVYTAGLGISFLMSQILAYSLNQVAIRATPLVHDYETFLEQLNFMATDDLLIVFSFPPYSKETIEIARHAAAKNISVIAITDKVTSPVTFYSVKTLPIRSQNMIFTNSFSAISVVINALATEVVTRNETKAIRNLKEMNKMLEESGHYSVE